MLSHQCEKLTRPATAADIAAIIAIIRITLQTKYVDDQKKPILSPHEENQFCEKARSEYLLNLNDDSVLTYVSIDDDKVIGFARLVKKEDYAYLDKLYVLPGQTKKSHGTRLMITCLKNAMHLFSVNTMKLYVWEKNESAINFYVMNTFKKTAMNLRLQFASGEYNSPEMVCTDCKAAFIKAIRHLGPHSTMAWNEYTELDSMGNQAKPEKVTETAASTVIASHMPLVAVDLGAGKGRDTRFLLEKGFQVLAVEGNELACEKLKELACNKLTIQQRSFEEMDLSVLPESASLVNASFSLPYAGPEQIETVMTKISSKLAIGGRFCGQFFGPSCSFVSDFNGKVAAHTQPQIVELLKSRQLEIEQCDVEVGEGTRMDKSVCHKEFYHVVARKIN